MKVETYEVISVDEQNGQVINERVSEEALALIEQMGLSGQRSLVQESVVDTETVVTRNPYRRMTAEEAAIFGAILPRRVNVEEYSDGPIPLRVLQVAAHALPLFEKVIVWCPAEPSTPDPLLVGTKKNAQQTWRDDVFILARWGDVLEPLDILRDRAAAIILARLRADIAKGRATLTAFEASLESGLASYLRGGARETAFFNVGY